MSDPTAPSDGARRLLARLIGSDFGAETNIDGRPHGGERHNAVDIKGRIGDDVLTAADGRVTFAGEDNPYSGQNPHLYWHTEPCFDPQRAYDAQPITFTLPIRCAK